MRLLSTKGIRQEFAATECAEQNGRAERRIQTLSNTFRSMLQQAGLTKAFWGEALQSTYPIEYPIRPSQIDRHLSRHSMERSLNCGTYARGAALPTRCEQAKGV
jgi:hypothetical protein